MAATHKTLFILTNALLEWILIIMLLFNSIFSFLIRKFATYYTLKPPCVWCSTIDHLLDPNNNVSAYQNLICQAHVTEFLNHYDIPGRQTMSSTRRCSCCSMNINQVMCVDRSFGGASKNKACYVGNGLVEFMDHGVENKSSYIQVFDQIIPLEWTDSSTSCSKSSSFNGDEDEKQEATFLKSSCQEEENKKDKVMTVDSLTAELKAERLVVRGLYVELDEERKASKEAANQAMKMITKLQEQKVAVQIESIQNKRMMDEQAEYDQEVLQLLNELVMKLENDKSELENEVEMYKEKVSDYEGKTKAKMMSKCTHCSCLVDTNDFGSKKLRGHDETVVEFEIERMWILDKLKELDETLSTTLTGDLNERIDEEAEASRFAWTRSMSHTCTHFVTLHLTSPVTVTPLSLPTPSMAGEELNRPPSLPPYPEMVFAAVDSLKEKEGSTKSSISNYIESTCGCLPEEHDNILTEQLNKLVENGELVLSNDNYTRPDASIPAKRGRGRPPKAKDPAATENQTEQVPEAQQEPQAPTGTQAPSQPGSEVKRGRGRPKKDPNAPSAPKKAKVASVPTPPSKTGRPRGRPRKVQAEPEQAGVEAN
ncbi:hypothetical protein QVD17_37180 [Tagetes erecta]|uniref:Uncharacterized protein n=1 Tax=Tagetes erecta TaxID=13708 RepID=A0AAD8NJU1_TARER|nr:hypothetical protein QVD17_37180 [Tagetes erecta]